MDTLTIGSRTFNSRLLVGTGKYKILQRPRSVGASGAEIVTVAIRRTNIGQEQGPNLLEFINPNTTTILPNTAGCYTIWCSQNFPVST